MTATDQRIMFIYWGRRGSLGRFAWQVMDAADAMADITPVMSVSRQTEALESFDRFGENLLPVDTFSSNLGAALQIHKVASIRSALTAELRRRPYTAAVTLMPHVWSALVAPVFRRAGVPYTTVLHDFTPHAGDLRTASVHRLLMQDVRRADRVVTLSRSVADDLVASGTVLPEKIHSLFHPDLTFGPSGERRRPAPGEPWRLLFLGRIMRYKGLSLLVDTLARLRADGVAVELGVFGEGALGPNEKRLAALGATVVNRWHTEPEIGEILAQYHVLVSSHLEASQSGVVAAALGAGMPVVATPVGGIREQIDDGATGLFAENVSSDALAAAIERLTSTPGLYETMVEAISTRRAERSIGAFTAALIDIARRPIGA